MALERIGLGGIFRFDSSQATPGISAARAQLKRLSGEASKVSAAASAMGGSLVGIGVAALPMTAAVGFGVKQAADFEQQMDAVGSVSRVAGEDMERLEFMAKKMGATTAFSATQAGIAQEGLARANFSVEESLAALPGVMNAASADAIPLGTAVDIVANALRGMGLEAQEAGRASDVLALASASSNTDMVGLSEGLKMVAASATTLGIPLEETVASLGMLADVGLKGTLGGTALTNMFNKLVKPTTAGRKAMQKYGIAIQKTEDGSMDFARTMLSIQQGLGGMSDKVEKARVLTELSGLRGQKAVSGLLKAMETGKFNRLIEELKNADGAAKEMAERRLSNLNGQITLLKSAIEGFNIEVFSELLEPMTQNTKGTTKFLSDIVVAMQALNSEGPEAKAALAEVGGTALAVAQGVKDGVGAVGEMMEWVRVKLGELSESMGGIALFEPRRLAKVITVFTIIAGAVAPIMIALGGVMLFVTTVLIPAIGAIGTVLGTIGTVVSVVFSAPILGAIAAIVGGFLLIQKEGESIGDTFGRIAEGIAAGFHFIVDNAIMPFVDAFQVRVLPAITMIKNAFGRFVTFAREEFGDFINGVSKGMDFIRPLIVGTFEILGSVAGFVLDNIALAFGALLEAIRPVIRIIKDLATLIIQGLLNSLQGLVRTIVKLSDAVGVELPAGIREFAQQDDVNLFVDTLSPQVGEGERGSDASALAAGAAQEAGQPVKVEANLNLKDERKLEIDNKLCVDGREVAVATAKHKQELADRSAFKTTPWQRRITLEQGAAPVGGV